MSYYPGTMTDVSIMEILEMGQLILMWDLLNLKIFVWSTKLSLISHDGCFQDWKAITQLQCVHKNINCTIQKMITEIIFNGPKD